VVGPLTLVMKGEELPVRTAWVGSPAQPASPKKLIVADPVPVLCLAAA
jgi:hypothetical protein